MIKNPILAWMSEIDKLFKALADDTRRKILHSLEANGPRPITRIADDYNMSRQAVTKHLQILKDAGLVIIRKKGREQICRGNFKNLEQVQSWVRNFQEYWDDDVFSLDNYLR